MIVRKKCYLTLTLFTKFIVAEPLYGSGSDFWQATIPVPTFDKLQFRFRLLYSISYGSGSGSGSASRPNKKHSFQKNFFEKIVPFYILSFFTGKKFLVNFCDSILFDSGFAKICN